MKNYNIPPIPVYFLFPGTRKWGEFDAFKLINDRIRRRKRKKKEEAFSSGPRSVLSLVWNRNVTFHVNLAHLTIYFVAPLRFFWLLIKITLVFLFFSPFSRISFFNSTLFFFDFFCLFVFPCPKVSQMLIGKVMQKRNLPKSENGWKKFPERLMLFFL